MAPTRNSACFNKDSLALLWQELPITPPHKAAYKRLLGSTQVVDLLYHFPYRLAKRQPAFTFQEFLQRFKEDPKAPVTTLITPYHHERPQRPHHPLKILASLEDGTPVEILYYNGKFSWIQQLYPIGMRKTITGTYAKVGPMIRYTHPDYVASDTLFEQHCGVYPIYPLTAGLSLGPMAALIQRLLSNHTPDLPEWLPPDLLQKKGWPSWRDALRKVHNPTHQDDLEPATSPALQRLIFDEFLARQLTLAEMRRQTTRQPGYVTALNGEAPGTSLVDALRTHLPFSLTQAQERALGEIRHDMCQPKPMRRLLQGDVGSGKTLVGFGAALWAIEAGFQVAYLAPTEILARQHWSKLAPLCQTLQVPLDFIIGGESRTKRGQASRSRLASGSTSLVIGTHALLEASVQFRNLGLAIVDEQHRFGVAQRLRLGLKTSSEENTNESPGKTTSPDLLAMTATPIPRSLQMTLYGNMDVSLLDEKPLGRQPIHTSLMAKDRMAEVIAGLQRHLATGGQAYWVCPLVEESEKLDLAAAQERCAGLTKVLGDQVAMVHGRMKAADKEASMESFVAGKVRVLVATTVIEVGVDVPTANLMIVEHAERFGLSQLHQLRGRVGRGSSKSFCLLLYDHPLTDAAKSRLSIMRNTEDGFLIAEEDLKLRGGGDIYSTQQSGFNIFRLGDLRRDLPLLREARDVAYQVLRDNAPYEEPPNTMSPLTVLKHLHKFNRDVKYLQAG